MFCFLLLILLILHCFSVNLDILHLAHMHPYERYACMSQLHENKIKENKWNTAWIYAIHCFKFYIHQLLSKIEKKCCCCWHFCWWKLVHLIHDNTIYGHGYGMRGEVDIWNCFRCTCQTGIELNQDDSISCTVIDKRQMKNGVTNFHKLSK